MAKKTNAEVFAAGLQNFDKQEPELQAIIADYFECPSSPDCIYDGGSDTPSCSECKIRWLLSEWRV